jgi:hypothetical protein
MTRTCRSINRLLTGLTNSVRQATAFTLASAVLVTACGGGSGGAEQPTAGSGTPSPSPSQSPAPPPPPPGAGAMLGSCPSFPATAVFNTRIDDVSKFPPHVSSDAWIRAIGGATALHADWGRTENASASDYYGIPMNLLSATSPETDWPSIAFGAGTAPDESDCAVANGNGGYGIVRDCSSQPAASLRFPIPRDAALKAEGGTCNDPAACGDRHVLIVEQGACRLWESYFTYRVGTQWTAYSTAAWDLNSNAMRPDTWTSADAAGLPMAPLLARADEASAGEIRHALRVTFRDAVIAYAHVWPARHRAGNSSGSIPFGALLRLKSSFVIPPNWSTQAKTVATAMQRYGLYVADIGSDMFVQGDPSAQWGSDTISQIQTLHVGDFEFVDLGAVTRDPSFSADSFAAGW